MPYRRNRTADPPRVALIVDNPYRDLPGIVLVAQRLCAAGVTCLLVPLNLEWWEVGALAPDFVLLTNIRRTRQEFARRLMDAGIPVGVLECEGGVMPNFTTYETMLGPDPALFRRLACVCTWGPTLARHAIESGWYAQEQVIVTGAPRFDFYAPQWRDAALDASADIDTVAQPIVLINGSFPRANPRFVSPEREIESGIRLGFDRDHLVRFQQVEARAMHEMAAVANLVAARFPSATVVYRPHPFERLETYGDLLEKRPNLHLLKTGTVEGWILRSAVVIHRNSTTAIEAGMAGIPALLPKWIPTAETLEACDAVSIRCTTPEGLFARVSEALRGVYVRDACLNAKIDRVVADWFHQIDGRSHCRVADAILEVLSNHQRRVSISDCRNIHYGWRPEQLSLRARVGIGLRMMLKLPVTWSFKDWRYQDPAAKWLKSDKYFDVPRIQELVSVLGRHLSPITVESAVAARQYRMSYEVGRTVVMRAENRAA